MALRVIAAVLSVAAVLFPFAGIVTGFLNPADSSSQPSYENLRPIAISIMVCGPLSLAGFVAGLVALRRTPAPRPAARKLECMATSLPLIVFAFLTTAFYIVFLNG